MPGGSRRSESSCSGCGHARLGLRDGLCRRCWLAAPERPKPVRDRVGKLAALRDAGLDPFAHSFSRTHTLGAARELFEKQQSRTRATDIEQGGEQQTVSVAGRLVSYRDLGGSAFAHIDDGGAELQIHLRRNKLDADSKATQPLLDLGDWVGVEGELFRTRRGEITVRVATVRLLSKSLRPLPLGKRVSGGASDEGGTGKAWGTLTDPETRYRQRYADLAVNPEVRELFKTRTRTVTAMRQFLDERGYLEVETPVLQPVYGGAAARPFVTEHNQLKRTMYLRIADELYLKRLVVGGLDRVYEIGHDFRNEGIDRTHNPEFTMLELYCAFADYSDMMDLVEELVTTAARAAAGGTTCEYDGRIVDLGTPWKRVRWADAFRGAVRADPARISVEDLRAALKKRGREDAANLSRVQLLDALFADLVESQVTDPVIFYDHPIEMSPLAKPCRDDPRYAERFEVLVAGFELANAFSELNDPIDQFDRFARQAALRAEGDDEAMVVDEDYLRALEFGLPPTGGLGLGVDRLLMLLTGKTSIREVVLFPMLRA